MSERALLGRSRSPILSLHHAIVGRGAAKRNPVALIVCTHTRKSTATRDAALEMIDVRWFQARACGLIVAAILV